MKKSIVIAERDNIAAVFEDGKITEFFIHRGDILLGDVYLSKVENILPSIEAAFVNVGSDKMGFLHAADVIGKGGLQDKLSPKQKLMVQVVKEPTGHKGPRVTTSISLPGRFLVLMPYESGVSVSKKISTPKERARLKSIVNLLKPVGLGVIIRTEAEGQTEAEIQEDLEILLEKWNTIVTQAEMVSAPNLLYRDQDLLYRVIREACDEDVKEIIVDTSFAMHRTQQLIQNWNLNKEIDISVYKGTEPLIAASGIQKEIRNALQIKVNLPSGGYLFIQTTEAMTVIDVNSGKFISSATQDETILKTNKEAVVEIARQLKLRNIGGMIIIDFIDMLSRADKLSILQELELAIESDKAKPQVGQLSDLGLVEMTRHRQGQSLDEIFTKKCQACQGTGHIIEEFTFSSSVAEGEYRSKAAKLKIPVGQIKKNSKKDNNVFNHQHNQSSNPSLTAKRQNDKKQKNAENIEFTPDDAVQKIKESSLSPELSSTVNVQNVSKDAKEKHFKNNRGGRKNVFNILDEIEEKTSEVRLEENTLPQVELMPESQEPHVYKEPDSVKPEDAPVQADTIETPAPSEENVITSEPVEASDAPQEKPKRKNTRTRKPTRPRKRSSAKKEKADETPSNE